MRFGPIQFDEPMWLLLIPLLVPITWLIARQSLSGLESTARWVALGVRWIVIIMVAVALARPHWRDEAEDVAVVLLADVSRSMPTGAAQSVKSFLAEAVSNDEPTDRLGVVTTAKDALTQLLPSRRRPPQDVTTSMNPDDWLSGQRDATNLADAVSMAMAIKPEDSALRLLLASDGNETQGSLLAMADSARAAGIPIDVLMVPHEARNEVIFDKLVVPETARRGQTVRLNFVLTATSVIRGRLSLLSNGTPVDLNPDDPDPSVIVDLEPGPNALPIPIRLDRSGPQTFEAFFEPLDRADDAIVENNRALGVTFVSGEGRAVILAETLEASRSIGEALLESNVEVQVLEPAGAFGSLTDLQAYDAVILIDVPASSFSANQRELLRAYVHDSGGGLVMVGGPESFGAGGWIGTPVADALPVKLDPPQKRQIPKGALVLIMHSCEAPRGNYWGQQTALAAAQALSRLDLVGVVEFSWNAATPNGIVWPYPLSPRGDGQAVTRAIKNLTFGDMPSFVPAMQQTLTALQGANAGQKHCIIISDGDPQPPPMAMLQQFANSKITISTVEVFPHAGFGTTGTMRTIANVTGGKYYFINTQGQLGQLPQIFTKEAQIVRRALIWEGDPFNPKIVNVGAEAMRGIGPSLPAISGYVVTAPREGLALTTIEGPENDPICAQWQYGLGRSVAFTSDAASRWSSAWVNWGQFRAFWDQHVRWAMRPSGSATIDVLTESSGAETKIIVTALDAAGDSLNFARFRGRLSRPDLTGDEVELQQTGPGRYEGTVPSEDAGTYLLSLRYDAPKPDGSGVEQGSVQAAFSRPFADEFRALRDNTALLRQVADLTGGRVIDPSDPSTAALFEREGLTFPVAMQSIWMGVAIAAISLFLVDVGVRRVRIDLRAIVSGVRRAAHRAEAKKEADLGALQAARAKAKQRMRTPSDDAEKPRVAQQKFEASESQLKAPAISPIDSPTRRDESGTPSRESDAGDDEESGGLSRLMQAKRRARESMDDRSKDND